MGVFGVPLLRRLAASGLSRVLDVDMVPKGSPWRDFPFGREQRAARDEYLAIFESARAKSYPAVDAFEEGRGFAIDKVWMDQLALITQVVIKESAINYQHGRVLYAEMRRYLETHEVSPTVIETGTARGFSSLCLARAIRDAGRRGRILTFDVLPHDVPMYWNCIRDCDGIASRRELLADYRDLLGDIVFIEGDTMAQLDHVSTGRVHFAYLDAQHTYENVMHEAAYVMDRQEAGDVIVFDDVTESQFPGVVEAVREIEGSGGYRAERLESEAARSYAVLTRR